MDVNKIALEAIPTPIGCSLSFGALKWAMDIGAQKNLGNPVSLVIGQGDWDVAFKMMNGPIPEEFKSSSLPIEVNQNMPEARWELIFEKGAVYSQGPA